MPELYSRLANDFGKLLENSENYDVIIEIGENDQIKSFKAHSLILGARSSYFHSALLNNWAQRLENGLIIFKKPNITPDVFQYILKYIYTGQIVYNEQKASEILDLLVASDELLLDELIEYFQEYLIEKHDNWLKNNATKVLHTCYHHESCEKLYKTCMNMVCLNPQRIFESENFHLIEQHVLSSILKRDDLSLNEFEIWNHIINWGIYNNDDFGESENVHEWSDKEFKSLGETLKELIPLIRFSNMKYKEFHDYVIPYKKILSSSFLTDLEKKFDSLITNQTLNGPTRILLSRKIDSRIIRYDNALKVETWISRSDGTISETTILKYQWKLLFRASLNGYTAKAFHDKCDDKGSCVVVVKIKDQELVIGGYNPLGWLEKEDYCVDAKGSFIYYFESLSNAKISRVKTDMFYAIPQHKFCGPEFGMIDFSIVDCCNEYKNNSCNPSSKYENTFTIGDFCVEDYEVFQILNK